MRQLYIKSSTKRRVLRLFFFSLNVRTSLFKNSNDVVSIIKRVQMSNSRFYSLFLFFSFLDFK